MSMEDNTPADRAMVRLALAAVALHGLLAGRLGDDFGEVAYPAAALRMADAVIEACGGTVADKAEGTI